MGDRLLAIDIGTRNIKLVWGRNKSSKLHLDGFSVAHTPGDAIKDGHLTDITALVQVIENELADKSIKPDRLVFTLSGPAVITRDILLPKSSEKEIEKILQFDAQQFFPIDLKGYIIDFKPLEYISSDDGVNSRVMLVAAPESHLDDLIKIGDSLDIPLEAIDINHNCVFKMVNAGHLLAQSNNGNVIDSEFAVVGLGHKYTNLSMYVDGMIKFSRSMPFGSAEVDAAIVNILQAACEDAEIYKIQKLNLAQISNQDEKQFQIQEAALRMIEMLANDLNRLFDFYKTNYNFGVNHVYLCGGASHLNGISNQFANSLNLPVSVINSENLANVIYHDKRTANDFQENIRFLIPAIGALIRK